MYKCSKCNKPFFMYKDKEDYEKDCNKRMKCVGIAIKNKDAIHIFKKSNYISEIEYNADWLKLTRKLSDESEWFTADPIMEEE